jgi:hypothetical protein
MRTISIAAALITVLAAIAPAFAQHDHHQPVAATNPDSLAAQIDSARRAAERYRDHRNAIADWLRPLR